MERKIFVDISARHVHLTRENMDVLFGKGSELTVKKMLGGGFAAEERVTLVSQKDTLQNVTILGPFRYTQVEISMTDARKLGMQPPIRISGNTKGSAPIKLVGPAGELDIEEGVIVAKRHIHISQVVADEYGIVNGQEVKVRVETPDRTLVFEDVLCRIQAEAPFGPPATMHIDTDEANASGIVGSTYGYIVD
jgi:putative phosphotransacetylase